MKSPRRSKAAKSIFTLDTNQALLAQILLHVMGEAGQKRKALALRNAGLSNAAIAALMGTSPEVIGSVLYQARRQGASRKGKRAAKRKRPAR
jgi:DNA-directed RNA polymerase specialized sigma24 family protein